MKPRLAPTKGPALSNKPELSEELLRQLESRSPASRANAVERLGFIGPVEALAVVVQHQHDRSPEVRMRVAEAIGRARDVDVKYLLEALDDADELVKVLAAESAGIRKDRRALPSLRRLLADPSSLVRGYAAAAIGACGTKSDRALLERRRRQERSDTAQIGLLEGLWLMNTRSALEHALRLLNSRDYRVRCSVARALSTTFLEQRTKNRISTALKERLSKERTLAARQAINEAVELVTPPR